MVKGEHKAAWAFAALILIAGANAVAVRFTIRELDPFWSASLRFAAGSAVFFLVLAARKGKLPRGKDLVGDLLYGVLGFGISYALFYWGSKTSQRVWLKSFSRSCHCSPSSLRQPTAWSG